MIKNVGSIERLLRIIVGAALIAGMWLKPEWIGIWGWIGIVPLLTGLLGWCPPYHLLGINTNKSK